MFWVILAILVFIGSLIITVELDWNEFITGPITGVLISLILLGGVFTSIIADKNISIEDMDIVETNEYNLYNMSTADEASYVAVGKYNQNSCYWYNKEDTTSTSGQTMVPISVNEDVNFYDITKDSNPHLVITHFEKKLSPWFYYFTPKRTRYDFYIPKDSIKYGFSIVSGGLLK
jgi:hypothetical protein